MRKVQPGTTTRRLAPLGAALLGAAALLALPATSAPAAEELPHINWSFSGLFGTYDLAAAQRGFQIYNSVCSNCHSLKQAFYRDLSGIGLSEEQIKTVAASKQIPTLNDEGQPAERPGLPSDHFRSPFANPLVARAANNGALPPDLSVITKAREGGANYVYGLLTGYSDPPAGFSLLQGMNYNRVFLGNQIGMIQPLSDGTVTYTDGTANTLDQQARDVITFLNYIAEPEMTERKRLGVKAVLFLLLLTGISYSIKRKLWSNLH
jgi:ubiquinol-cytochrome c reductase cytochrome c1 subunit